MTRSLCLLSLASLLAVGCVATELKGAPEDLELVDGDDAADAFTRGLELRGTIELGQSIDADFATEGYAGWVFTAAAGANVVLDAAGRDGSDTVMFLYGPLARHDWSRMRPIAANDDSRGSLDSHLDVTLRASGTYLVVVLDYWGEPGSFALSLGCGGGECRVECGADDFCPTGSTCERVFCIRAPCPSFCGADGPEAPIEPTDPTGRACGGRTVDGPRECPADFYCAYTPEAICGRADAPGTCQRRPEACITLYDPVCGCDGNTYGNACSAASYGVSVDRVGECEVTPEPEPEPGATCGGFVGARCPEGEFCSFDESAMCGFADATGTCRTQPEICTREYNPVCGCDGRTYSNACTANAAGVSVRSAGECR